MVGSQQYVWALLPSQKYGALTNLIALTDKLAVRLVNADCTVPIPSQCPYDCLPGGNNAHLVSQCWFMVYVVNRILLRRCLCLHPGLCEPEQWLPGIAFSSLLTRTVLIIFPLLPSKQTGFCASSNTQTGCTLTPPNNLACQDGNACVTRTCVNGVGCNTTINVNVTQCNDNNPCTGMSLLMYMQSLSFCSYKSTTIAYLVACATGRSIILRIVVLTFAQLPSASTVFAPLCQPIPVPTRIPTIVSTSLALQLMVISFFSYSNFSLFFSPRQTYLFSRTNYMSYHSDTWWFQL